MAEFLSPAWIAELDAALRALDTVVPTETGAEGPATAHDPAHEFVMEQRVRRDDGTVLAHHVVAGGGHFRAVAGSAPTPDLVLTIDLGTAIALHRGVVTAQSALASGHLRLGGDLDRLRSCAGRFAALDDVFVTLRAETTYPATSGGEPGGDPMDGSPDDRR